MLSSCICSTLVSVCAMNGIPTGSVRKGLDILYYLTPFICLVNEIGTTLVVQVEGRTCLRAEYFTYIHNIHTLYKICLFKVGQFIILTKKKTSSSILPINCVWEPTYGEKVQAVIQQTNLKQSLGFTDILQVGLLRTQHSGIYSLPS